MVEEDVLVGGVGRHVAVTRLHVVGVFGGVPLHGRTGRRAGHGVVSNRRARCGRPTP